MFALGKSGPSCGACASALLAEDVQPRDYGFIAGSLLIISYSCRNSNRRGFKTGDFRKFFFDGAKEAKLLAKIAGGIAIFRKRV